MDLNPLAIPEILGTIFKYFGLAELLNARLVCRSWNAESSIYIGIRKIICINNEETFIKLSKLIKENPSQPFRSFELWSFPINLDNEQMLECISNCSVYIHRLTLNFDKDTNDQINLRTLRDLFLYYLPNLKSLVIRQLPFKIISQDWIFPPQGESKFKESLIPTLKSLTIYSDGDYNVNFLCNLIASTKSLEEIIVEYGDEPRDFKKTFLTAIFSCSSYLQNLNSLQYFMHDPGVGPEWAWTSEECENFAQMKFKLTKVKLHPEGNGETKSLYLLMKSLSTTLETLKLRVHDQLNCPEMNNLTTITLYDYEGSLTFLDKMPNLRHLGLCEYSPARYLTPDNITCKKPHSLISLNLYGSNQIPTFLFRSIASSFPNLRGLNFWHMTNKKLKIVFEKFLLLEELTMNVMDVDDEAFTGFPIDLCEQMERLGNFSNYISQKDKLRHGSHIGELKCLNRLEMHGACLADWKWSSMSDVSILFGILHLPSLTSLSLYEFKWITEGSIRKICESLPLVYLKFDYRVFSENLLTEVKLLRPDMRVESVTDEFESYSTFSSHAHHL